MISTRQLEVLNAVIEVGSTVRAAELLCVSQPAVSNMIRHTEDLIGIKLFERSKGRLTPTKDAIYIAQEAQHLFMQHKRVMEIVQELREGSRGSLSIAASSSLCLGIIPRILGRFCAGRDKLKVSFEMGSIDMICDLLASGRADVGFAITVPRHPAISHHPICSGELVCVCPPNHAFAKMERVNAIDFNETVHISYSAATPLGQIIDRVFADRGLERRYAYEVRHTAIALEMVASGLGVALIDSFALVGRKPGNVVQVPVEPTMKIQISAMTSRLFPTPRLANLFLSSFPDLIAAVD